MEAEIKRCQDVLEFETRERCHVCEVANDAGDAGVSVARIRVAPGVTTAWHLLQGVDERYIIVSGGGRLELGDLSPAAVAVGDVVRIPAGTRQRIANAGPDDLVFWAVCTPRFTPACYVHLE
jgi:mannose-6-phosphate isomerase-like protein (cupin superfamily)